jgi:hypothetical protein
MKGHATSVHGEHEDEHLGAATLLCVLCAAVVKIALCPREASVFPFCRDHILCAWRTRER